jgi:DNA-binding response OmpR family regulator
MNILMIEDETRVAGFIRRGLAAEGWSIDHACDGETGLELARASAYDVILLDRMLPGIQGSEVCRALRTRKNATPILMLTALDASDEKVEGLRIGADDYLTKPFDFDELVARIEALRRRAALHGTDSEPEAISIGTISYDRQAMKVHVRDEEIQLSKKERDLLVLFLTNPGRVLSRERILNSVWGMNEDPLTNIVDVYVGRIRRKLGAESGRIATLRDVGYRMD